MFDESHWNKMKVSVCRYIGMNGRKAFKLTVTAILGLHSLFDWCYLMIWYLSGAPHNAENDTFMELHGTEELHSAVNSMIHAIPTEDNESEQDAAHHQIEIVKPLTIRKSSE